MSYTADDERLNPSIDLMLEGMDAFHIAAQVRVENSASWSQSHLRELMRLRQTLLSIELELRHLRSHTV